MKGLIRLLIVLLLSLGCPTHSSAQSTAAELFREATGFFQRGDLTSAAKLLEKAVEAAVQESNRQVEADSRLGLGEYSTGNGQYESAEKHFKAALALFEQLKNVPKAASVKTFLGANAYRWGKQEESARYYQEAMSTYASINDSAAIAQLHYSLSFFAKTKEDFVDHIQSGLQLAREIGNRGVEAKLLHQWADASYSADAFDGAFDHLNQARSIFEELGDRVSLAGVLTSLGRLYRVHGHPDQAIPFYQEARDLQLKTGDKAGVIQSLNAIGVALNVLGRHSEALVRFDEALGLARETGSPSSIAFILNGLASTHLNLKQYQSAADLLEQSKLISTRDIAVFRLLAEARLGLGQYEAALRAATDGLLDGISGENLRGLHLKRARALRKLGKTSEALADIRVATESLESARRALIPTDFMKQGFSDTDREITTLAIEVLLDSNQPRQALAVAEQARGRAFLDLLATKGLALDMPASIPALITRGGTRDLPSSAAARSAFGDEIVLLAKRLDATILAYWVGTDSTTIWTVSPAGLVSAVHAGTGESTLSKWIDDASHPLSQTSNGKSQPAQLVTRAGDTVLIGRANQTAWKRLYDALIRPVRASLPSKGAHRLLIIPSGPLFHLSFAALMDERGRYLIEDYSLHYAPNAAVFSYTLQTKQQAQKLAGPYVFVSNPTGMPPLADGRPLAALPGSDDEVRKIAKLFPADAISTLRGADANETKVRNAIESAKVIHFATHGVVSNDDSLASYLALGRGADASVDGRLSGEEIYDLNLHADLVVLSACRTGLGRISGDGVAGLARAFFYAGAASVVATLWDVADEPASQLVADFYRSLGPTLQNDKSEALRNAQLRLLRSLRNGEVRVNTPFGRLPLPEDPSLWAGFVLMGEP